MSRPGVIFDVDGTLVDTTYLHTEAWWEALRQHDRDVPMAEIHRAIGMGTEQILDHLLGADRDKAQDGEITVAHDVLYAAWWERLRPLPGAAELLAAVAGRGLAVVLASAAKESELRVLRRVLGADDVIAAAASSADAAHGNPEPDVLRAALERAGLDPQRAVFVGDSVWDVEAAVRLHIPAIGLLCGGTSADELVKAGAVATYDDPADLLRQLDRSAIADLAAG
ncbi:MAG TPA: HAD family hydrolase [Actinoplanes sp.]|nr:HAD family hydrolase [Actinoplanes sp.]